MTNLKSALLFFSHFCFEAIDNTVTMDTCNLIFPYEFCEIFQLNSKFFVTSSEIEHKRKSCSLRIWEIEVKIAFFYVSISFFGCFFAYSPWRYNIAHAIIRFEFHKSSNFIAKFPDVHPYLVEQWNSTFLYKLFSCFYFFILCEEKPLFILSINSCEK